MREDAPHDHAPGMSDAESPPQVPAASTTDLRDHGRPDATTTRSSPGGSAVLGGPIGRHAAVNRWLFSIMVIITMMTAATATLGWVQKASCMTHGYSHEYQYTRLCYSDIYALYYAEELDTDKIPYRDHAVEYPVVMGGVMEVARRWPHDLAPQQYQSQWFFTITAGILGGAAILLAGGDGQAGRAAALGRGAVRVRRRCCCSTSIPTGTCWRRPSPASPCSPGPVVGR